MGKDAIRKLQAEIRKRICDADMMSEEEVRSLESQCYHGYDITVDLEFHQR